MKKLHAPLILALSLISGLASAGDLLDPLAPPVVEDEKGDWEIQFRPYLWTADLSGEVGLGPVKSDVDVDFKDILNALEMSWASTIDIRQIDGKWSFFLDTFYMRLDPGGSGPIKDVQIEQAIVDMWIGYRLFENERTWVELVGGVRWIYLNNEIETMGGLELERDDSWFDPHIGIRAKHYLGEKFYVAGGFDIGGFGVGSDLTWQTATTLGYKVNEHLAFEVSYRFLSVDYDDEGLLYDTETNGFLLGFAYTF